MQHNTTGLVIAMPTRMEPTRETSWALEHNTPASIPVLTCRGLPVDSARNALANYVLGIVPLPEIAVLIDDAWRCPGTIETILGVLRLNRTRWDLQFGDAP